MKFENLNVFYEWLKENVKANCYDEKAYIENFETQIDETGSNDYELS